MGIKPKKLFLNNQNTKVCHFFKSNFGTCKSQNNDGKGMDVAQPIRLSGCPTKGNFSANNAFLVVFWLFKKNVFLLN